MFPKTYDIRRGVWAIRQDAFAQMLVLYRQALALDGPPPAVPNKSDWLALTADPPEERYLVTEGGTAVLLVDGVIGKNLSFMEQLFFGGYELNWLEHDLAALSEDPAVKQVLLTIRSPGGIVTGVPEAAAAIAGFGKPIVAVTDAECCSAGYWLASQAAEAWLTPSAEMGSIGVYSAFVDSSAAWAKEGLKLEVIRDGTNKGTLMDGLALSESDRALIQDDVSAIGATFRDAIASHRPKISTENMQGQLFRGQKAVDAGFADLLVGSWSEAVELLDL